jgi:hypothetical protein
LMRPEITKHFVDELRREIGTSEGRQRTLKKARFDTRGAIM